MSEARQAAKRAAVTKALADRIKTAREEANREVLDQLDAGDRKSAVLDEDGTNIGTVSVVAGRVTAKVTDDAALLAWVEQHAPAEVVSSIRTSYRKALLDKLENVDGEAFDPDTGENVPGVAFRAGEPYVSVRQSADQAGAVGAAWQDGRLSDVLAGVVAALTRGDE